MNYNKIDSVEIEDLDYSDYPYFCDAYIASANYKGTPMNDKQLDEINEDYDYVYNQIIEKIF